MHERSMAQALLGQISDIARQHPTSHVAIVRLSIGRFSGIEPQLFEMALEELLAASTHSGAKVEMKIVEIEAQCPECQQTFAVKSFHFTCPNCGCQRTQVTQGEDLVLESLVLKEAESCPIPK